MTKTSVDRDFWVLEIFEDLRFLGGGGILKKFKNLRGKG